MAVPYIRQNPYDIYNLFTATEPQVSPYVQAQLGGETNDLRARASSGISSGMPSAPNLMNTDYGGLETAAEAWKNRDKGIDYSLGAGMEPSVGLKLPQPTVSTGQMPSIGMDTQPSVGMQAGGGVGLRIPGADEFRLTDWWGGL